MDLARAPCRAPLTARKMGSGYENDFSTVAISYPEPSRVHSTQSFARPMYQPRTQGICSWGAKYPGMVWSRDPRILRKMAYCLLGLGGEYILSQLNMINLIALII